MLNKSINKIFQIFDSIIYYFFFKKKVLFYIKNEIGYVQQYPMIEKLKINKKVKLFFALDPQCELDYETVKQDLESVGGISLRTLRIRKFSCVIATDQYVHWHIRKCPIVIFSHGSAIGNCDKSTDIWPVFCWSRLNSNVCVINSKAEFDHLDLLSRKVRFSKNKIFLLGGSIKQRASIKAESEGLEKALNFGEGVKVVVVFSHYTKWSLLRNQGRFLIDAILRENPDVEIVITGHPKLWTENTKFKDGSGIIHDYFKELSRRQKKIHFYDGAATTDIMSIGDIFICDYSSVRVELAAWDKPTFLYLDKEFEFQSKNTGRMYIDSSYVFSDLEKLCDLLGQWNEILLPNTPITNRELFEYFSHDPEGSLDRSVRAINELISIPYIGSVKWNAFREKSELELSRVFINN